MLKYAVVILLICCRIGVQGQTWCYPQDFKCDNGCCFDKEYVCDGYDDCGDGSDEIEPECAICNTSTHMKCDNGRCVPISWQCDGWDDCGDDSDEKIPPELCPPCGKYEYKCKNGRCIYDSELCDGDNDCGDNSDEDIDPALCPPCDGYKDWRCYNGRCTYEAYVCDFKNDCGDGSDERQPHCRPCDTYEWLAPCDIGGCVRKEKYCDWNNDCLDWSDETAEACPCADTEIRCPFPDGPPEHRPIRMSCIPTENWCDAERIWDCPDGADEKDCDRPNDHLNVPKYRQEMNLTNIENPKSRRKSRIPIYCPDKQTKI